MQICVTSIYQGSRRWPHHSRRSSGLRGFAIASTQKHRASSTPSARSSSKARTQKGWGPLPRHLSFRPHLLPRRHRQPERSRFQGQDGSLPRSGTVQRSLLQACPHWCTMMTGVVDVPTALQLATGDASSRRMDSPPSKDTEGAPLGLSVPSCSEDFNYISGGQDAPPSAPASFQPSQLRVLEQCGATAASLRHALSLGDYALGVLSKGIPESVLYEVHDWGYADDEEAFTNILIFTDGSGTMTNTWPPNIVTQDGLLLSWDG